MMTMRSRIALGISAALATLVAAVPALFARETSHAEIERGRYLAAAGDCAACHTAERGQPFAGGRAIPTPFGTIYSTNITPDPTTGIGHWTSDDFYRAMHEGIAPGDRHLYPAFPYPWYTKLSRADVDSIKTFLETLTPVRQANKPPELPWPFSMREVMSGWNGLYFHEGTYRSNSQKSPEWNLGAYLVEGLGHCGACHTPKNFAGAPHRDRAFQGGYGENWYATSLGGDLHDGLGSWSVDDVVKFLKTGANDKAAAFGPMAEVVHNSTQHLDEKDLHAMAVYLKDLPPHEASPNATTASGGGKQDADRLARGRGIYLDNCAACHMEDGAGIAGVFPPLKGNAVVQASDPETLAHIVLAGEQRAITKTRPTGFAMPAFDWKLDNDQIADLSTYLRSAWGNRAGPVGADKVADTRKTVIAARTK